MNRCDFYEGYLKTPDWQIKRSQVLERCGGVCEACRVKPATEVHHTTYAHLGNEPLWELRGICHDCHELLTRLDRDRRAGAA
jgi:5-methylcytosine-specific restriction endonuclease McrA